MNAIPSVYSVFNFTAILYDRSMTRQWLAWNILANMFCSNCGSDVDNCKFCRTCGKGKRNVALTLSHIRVVLINSPFTNKLGTAGKKYIFFGAAYSFIAHIRKTAPPTSPGVEYTNVQQECTKKLFNFLRFVSSTHGLIYQKKPITFLHNNENVTIKHLPWASWL